MFAQVRGTLSSKQVGWLGRRNRAVKAWQGVKTEDSACHGPGSGASAASASPGSSARPGQARVEIEESADAVSRSPTVDFKPCVRAYPPISAMGHGVVDRGPSAGTLCGETKRFESVIFEFDPSNFQPCVSDSGLPTCQRARG